MVLDGTGIDNAALAALAAAPCTALRSVTCRQCGKVTQLALASLAKVGSRLQIIDLTETATGRPPPPNLTVLYGLVRARPVRCRSSVLTLFSRRPDAGHRLTELATQCQRLERVMLPRLGLPRAGLLALVAHAGSRWTVLDLSGNADVDDNVLFAIGRVCTSLSRYGAWAGSRVTVHRG